MAEQEPKKKSLSLSEMKKLEDQARMEIDRIHAEQDLEEQVDIFWQIPRFAELRDHIKNRKQFYVKTWNKLKSQLAIMSIGATEAVALSTIPGLEQFKGLVAVAFLVTLSEVIWTFWSTIVNDYTKIEEEKREILAELKSLQFHNFVLNKLNEWPDFFETLPDVIEKIEQKERQKMDEWLTAAQDRLVVGEDGELVDPLGENFDDFTQQTTS